MRRKQKFVQYIQQLAYESLFQPDERDERPEDAPPAPQTPAFKNTWNATSFASYEPFRWPTNS